MTQLVELKKVAGTVTLKELNTAQAKELQTALNELEFNCGVVDGIVGPKTDKAYDNFKTTYKLTHLGLIGPTTVKTIEILIIGNDDLTEDDGGPNPLQPVLTKPLIVTSKINWNDFDCPVSKYFSVGEVTQWDKRRVPTDQKIIKNILAIAAELDKIRFDYKGAIGVNSWYRPPAINRAIGGAKYSQHLTGGAVDIRPADGQNMAGFQNWLNTYWYGALGKGWRKGFCHCDMRNGNGWKRGTSKGPRWNY